MKTKLDGLRLLDLSQAIAGPWACQMLGDLGADVIKIERPGSGDSARAWGPPFLGDGDGTTGRDSAAYLSANRNKRGMTIDFTRPEGRDLLLKLVARSDVLVENFKVGTLDRAGLGYEAVAAVNPRIIYCSISGFGSFGPLSDRPGYDPVFQALSGIMAASGLPDGEPGAGPMRTSLSFTDLMGGLMANVAILAALHRRDSQPGARGEHVEIALLDCAIAAMSHLAMTSLLTGHPPERWGNAGNNGVPSGAYHCRDGMILVSPATDRQFAGLCEVLGESGLAQDPRYREQSGRLSHRAELVGKVAALMVERSVGELDEALAKAGVPAAPILDFNQAIASPHAQTRGLQVNVPHPLAEGLSLLANPIRFGGRMTDRYSPPPRLGEHGDAILREEIGLSDCEIADLRAIGAI